MPFSSEIKNFRLSCLMNQTEFGNALGVSFTTVNRWENGKARPNIKAMKALKQYCEECGLPYEPLEKSWRENRIQEGAVGSTSVIMKNIGITTVLRLRKPLAGCPRAFGKPIPPLPIPTAVLSCWEWKNGRINPCTR